MTIYNVLVKFSGGDNSIKSFYVAEDAIEEANNITNTSMFTNHIDNIFESEVGKVGDIIEVEILSSELN